MRTFNVFHQPARRPAPTNRRNKGAAVLEMAFLAPWFMFLFIGVVDLGFYCYDLMAVENAARVAAEYTSSESSTASDSTGACTRVLAEMASLPNVSGLANCNALPIQVTVTSGTGLGSTGTQTSVTVTYQSQRLVPIPGLLPGRMIFSRTVVARVNS